MTDPNKSQDHDELLEVAAAYYADAHEVNIVEETNRQMDTLFRLDAMGETEMDDG